MGKSYRLMEQEIHNWIMLTFLQSVRKQMTENEIGAQVMMKEDQKETEFYDFLDYS